MRVPEGLFFSCQALSHFTPLPDCLFFFQLEKPATQFSVAKPDEMRRKSSLKRGFVHHEMTPSCLEGCNRTRFSDVDASWGQSSCYSLHCITSFDSLLPQDWTVWAKWFSPSSSSSPTLFYLRLCQFLAPDNCLQPYGRLSIQSQPSEVEHPLLGFHILTRWKQVCK